MPVHPIQFTNPGGHCFCPPFTCLNQETGTLVPIAVPVITKKNLLFPPTPTISSLKQLHLCSQKWSLCPRNLSLACPTELLAQHSSSGPVPPAVAADSTATAESPAPEYPADGDQTLLNIFPLATVATLEYPGLATIFLCHLVPNIFPQPANYLMSPTPSPHYSPSLWLCRTHQPSSPTLQTSSA